jgi:GH43 family beta-xylosidase
MSSRRLCLVVALSSACGVPGEIDGDVDAGVAIDDGGLDDANADASVELPAQPGFTAQYFDQYRVLKHTVAELTVQHAWGTASPAPEVGADSFSARYTASLTVPTTGTYTFATRGDDGVRLWVAGKLVIDDWRPHAAERHTGTIALTAGVVPIRLDYFEHVGAAELTLTWIQPGGTEQPIDSSHTETAAVIPGAPKPPYQNSVIDTSCPDPGVLATGSPPVYYALCTGGKFRIRRSHDLVMWKDTGAVVFPSGKPAWAANGNRNWAPEMHYVNGKYLVYYTSVNANDVLSIGVTSSTSPTGPFTDRGSPLVQHPQGVIDATYIKVGTKHYLAYKIDGNSVGQPTPIYLRELAANGMSFAAGSTQVEILRNNPSTWEGGVVEAPWIIERNGTFFLFYSGNVYDSRYRTGVARASSVKGPYTKLATPILRNDATWVGPGHGSVVTVGTHLYFVYHAWHNNGSGGNDTTRGRNVLVDEITFANGWPKINDGTPSEGLRPWPGTN